MKFSWGVSKRHFRKINDCKGKDLHVNIKKSFTVIDLPQAKRNARKTRRYGVAQHVTPLENQKSSWSPPLFALVEK
jgi:hypothetical protein